MSTLPIFFKLAGTNLQGLLKPDPASGRRFQSTHNCKGLDLYPYFKQEVIKGIVTLVGQKRAERHPKFMSYHIQDTLEYIQGILAYTRSIARVI